MWDKITKKQAMEIMGTHAEEIPNGERGLLAAGFRDGSYCIPSTGKSLWVHRRGCVFTYSIER